MTKYHELKTWPVVFRATASGLKTFEFRENDRDFQVGDILILREWKPEIEKYTDSQIKAIVTYILDDGFGVPDGYVVMNIRVLDII